MAAGFGVLGRDVGIVGKTRHYHLQCCHQCVRERWIIAAGFGAPSLTMLPPVLARKAARCKDLGGSLLDYY